MSIYEMIQQPRVLLSKWGLTGTRLRAIFVALCIVAVVLILYATAPFKKLFRNMEEEQTRIQSGLYCFKPGSVQGKEGQLQVARTKSNYTLEQLFMVIRHGDRAPIVLDTIPNSKRVEISCKFSSPWPFQDRLAKMKQAASNFEITGNPKRTVIEERDVCIGGQLTPIGYLQHLLNGEFYNKKYSGFIKNFKSPSEILVMSTDYSRTVQSVAALLTGMFGGTFQHHDDKIKIQVQHDKYRESHFLKDDRENQIYCPALGLKLKEIWKTEKLRSLKKVIDPVRMEYSELFGINIGEVASLDRLIDILYADLCHGKNLPKGPNGKVSYSLASRSFQLADRLITEKHAPIAELQTLAIVSRIMLEISNHIAQKGNKRKLVVFSGHDTVILPLLVLLGVHDDKWPPYASRVVFELWRNANGPKSPNEDEVFSTFQNYYFKILYNGKPLTSSVKICQGKIVDDNLCPIGEFLKYVSEGEFDGSNFFERIKNLCIYTGA